MVSGKQAVAYRNYRRARDRALARLANAYPDQYKQYLEEEKANDEQLGKRWIAADTSIAISQLGTRADSSTTQTRSGNEGENEGNNGGEA
jgi:hypothetical protein